MSQTSVLLIDDHQIVSAGIASLLSATGNYTVHVISDPTKALSYIHQHSPQLVISDYNMPGMNGVELVNTIRSVYPLLPVLILSMHDSPQIAMDIITSGANGYILKQNSTTELIRGIEQVLQGEIYYSAPISKLVVSKTLQQQVIHLTEREKQVLQLLAQARTSKAIAAELFISERTVETHRTNLLRKTNTSNTIALLDFARQHLGVIT